MLKKLLGTCWDKQNLMNWWMFLPLTPISQVSQTYFTFCDFLRFLSVKFAHVRKMFLACTQYQDFMFHIIYWRQYESHLFKEASKMIKSLKHHHSLNGETFVVIVTLASFLKPIIIKWGNQKEICSRYVCLPRISRPEPALTLVSSCSCAHFNHASFRSDWIFIGLFTLNHRQPLPLCPIGAHNSRAPLLNAQLNPRRSFAPGNLWLGRPGSV